MNLGELGFCLVSMICSSVSQLFMKGASTHAHFVKRLFYLSAAGSLQLLSIACAVIALQTLPLSKVVIFAAGAYLLVPMCSALLFGEHLNHRFWLGGLFIALGIIGIQA
jgi:drug/metabolite transporter (DMT)-like permease